MKRYYATYRTSKLLPLWPHLLSHFLLHILCWLHSPPCCSSSGTLTSQHIYYVSCLPGPSYSKLLCLFLVLFFPTLFFPMVPLIYDMLIMYEFVICWIRYKHEIILLTAIFPVPKTVPGTCRHSNICGLNAC